MTVFVPYRAPHTGREISTANQPRCEVTHHL